MLLLMSLYIVITDTYARVIIYFLFMLALNLVVAAYIWYFCLTFDTVFNLGIKTSKNIYTQVLSVQIKWFFCSRQILSSRMILNRTPPCSFWNWTFRSSIMIIRSTITYITYTNIYIWILQFGLEQRIMI